MFARATSLSATGGPSTTISFGGSGGGGGIGGGGGGITKKTSFKGGGSSAILAAAAVVGSQAFLSRDSALFQDLIGGQPTERNWKGIVCALTVIISICSMIFICILLFTPMGSSSLLDGTPMELKDVVGPAFMSPIESMEWVDDNHIAIRYGDHLELLNVNKTLPDGFATTVLLDSETLYRYGKPNAIGVTTGRRYILAGYNGNKKANRLIFRIYDIKDSSFENIGPKKSGDENIQVLAWNPVGNDFAFVHENNIYYQNGPGTKEVKQITTSGNISVLNGVADWLYEEEIFQTNKALWWSKDGNELGYLTIDDTIVDKIEFSRYSKLQYPETVRLPYPKTGAQNLPKVTLNIWNKKNESKKEMEIEVRDPSLGVYLFSAKWVTLFDKNVLIAIWANRYQNHTTLTLCTFDSGKCVHNYEQRYTLGGMKLWAEPEDFQDVKSFHTDSSFFLLLPSQKPSGDIFTQIAKITVTPNLATAKVAFLSMAEYDVDKINYFDSKNNLIYYTAAAPNPTQKHLYVASANPNIIGQSRCVTCNISPQNCSYHESSFSNNGNHFFMNCKGPGTPHVIMTSISSNFKNLAEYGRNPYLEKATTFSGVLPKVRFENITLRNGFVSQVKMLIPPSLETSSVDKRYPVLVDVYGGPGSQKATEEWLANNIDIYFASNPEYIVVFIDGRGSGNRGWKQKAPIYGNFGTVEVDDQIETIRRLLTKHKFMDKRRVAIWGWSYGGFVAAKAIERDPKQTFRCAAAVAPVSHFKYYDATYTERYMGAASSDAYSETDLTKNVTAFHDINFLLVHGTADDNVHFQNTAVFVKALSDENVQFDLAVYTDDSHNLASSRWALYNKLSIFLSNCFNDKKLY